MRGLTANLLGLPAIEALDLVRRVQNKDIFSGYPRLLTGLGRFDEEYTIQLKADAVPHAFQTTAVVRELNHLKSE